MSADHPELFDLGRPIKLGEYTRDLWARRDYLLTVPRRESRERNADFLFGQLWLIINPALMITVYFVVFGVIIQSNRGSADFLSRLVVGVLFFRMTQAVIQASTSSVERSRGLIRSIQFPRALLPLGIVIGQMYSFFPSLIVMFVVVGLAGVEPMWQWLLLPAVLLAHFLLNTGFSLVAARAGFAFNDLGPLLTHLFRVLMYGSGVIFPIEDYIESERVLNYLAINPIYAIIGVTRWVVIDSDLRSAQLWSLVIWCLLIVPIGFRAFFGAERRYGE